MIRPRSHSARTIGSTATGAVWPHLLSLAIEAGVLAQAVLASAQSFQQLHNFTGPPDGANPEGALIQASDGNFYGTTVYGGVFTNNGDSDGLGTVFRLTPDGVLSVAASFDGTNGMYPAGGLVQGPDGSFYGATSDGGPGYPNSLHLGTLFRLSPDGALATLVRFNGDNGQEPLGDLVFGRDGHLYGVTEYGGSDFIDPYYYPGFGTVFRLSTNGDFTTLVSFAWDGRATNGLNPSGALILRPDGDFYGVTPSGGPGGYGTVYRMSPSGGLTTIASVFRGTNAWWPVGRLLEATDGNLYGVAGGGTVDSAVFRVTPAGVLSSTALLTYADGDTPIGGLVEGWDGCLYGAAYAGGSSYGTVFRMTPEGQLDALVKFTGYGGSHPGAHPLSSLTQGTDGNLYGTCAFGTCNVFRIIMPGPRLSLDRVGGQLLLSWRTNYAGFALQFSTNLALANWTVCTKPPMVVDHEYYVTNPVTGPNAFYRLKK
jgi:uncharacterized repeat protein (TIGR03803 family)